jgi:hypothetical protein
VTKNLDKSIEAIVDVGSFGGIASPWIISKDEFGWVRIFAGISDDEIGSVMLSACRLSSEEVIKETALETLKAFGSDEGFVLEGGLLLKENGDIKVGPGCCGGLENWRDWLAVPSGIVDIWTGHDPQSLIEINEGVIKIWNDRENKDEKQSIEFGIEKMIRRLENVEKDLKDFLYRLGQWTENLAPELKKPVVRHFAKNIGIKY